MSGILAPLWQLDETLIALLDSVATCPPEMEAELAAEIEKYLGAEVEKVDNCCHVLSALEYERKCAFDEIARLTQRMRATSASEERFEQYLCRIIAARGGKPLKGKTNTLSVRTSDAVVITGEALVPLPYKTATVVMPAEDWAVLGAAFQMRGIEAKYTPDKAMIKKAIKAGEDVPGCDLEFRNNLQRK